MGLCKRGGILPGSVLPMWRAALAAPALAGAPVLPGARSLVDAGLLPANVPHVTQSVKVGAGVAAGWGAVGVDPVPPGDRTWLLDHDAAGVFEHVAGSAHG